MEMKINFNKLFEVSHTTSMTQSTTSLEHSYQFDEPSIIQSQQNKIDYRYKFDDALFDNSLIHNNSRILHQLSSIGRSLEHSLQKSKQKQKQQQKQDNSSFLRQNVYPNDKLRAPGQRLYYQAKIDNERKQKQLTRIKQQLQQQQSKQTTFKPQTNQRSKKLLLQAQSPVNKKKKKVVTNILKPSTQLKLQEQLKNCTFKPIINSQNDTFNKNKFISTSQRKQGQVFNQLYHTHKVREMKRKILIEEQQQAKKQRKMTNQQLNQFFQRNQQYHQQKVQKEQIMKDVSHQYDLTSGRKLFSPKVLQYTPVLFNSSSKKSINTPPHKKSSQKQSKINSQVRRQKNKSVNEDFITRSSQQIFVSGSQTKIKSSKDLFNKIHSVSNHELQHSYQSNLQDSSSIYANANGLKNFQQMKQQVKRRLNISNNSNPYNLATKTQNIIDHQIQNDEVYSQKNGHKSVHQIIQQIQQSESDKPSSNQQVDQFNHQIDIQQISQYKIKQKQLSQKQISDNQYKSYNQYKSNNQQQPNNQQQSDNQQQPNNQQQSNQFIFYDKKIQTTPQNNQNYQQVQQQQISQSEKSINQQSNHHTQSIYQLHQDIQEQKVEQTFVQSQMIQIQQSQIEVQQIVMKVQQGQKIQVQQSQTKVQQSDIKVQQSDIKVYSEVQSNFKSKIQTSKNNQSEISNSVKNQQLQVPKISPSKPKSINIASLIKAKKKLASPVLKE